MFNLMADLAQHNLVKFIYILITSGFTLGFSIWASIDDIKTMKVYFWKMLLLGSSSVLSVVLYSPFSRFGWKFAICMILSIPVYFFLLYLNIKFNKQKIIGKADIDVIAAYMALGLMFSIWSYWERGTKSLFIDIPYIWSYTFGSMLIGLIVGMLVFFGYYTLLVLQKKRSYYTLMKTPVSAIPMFIIPSIAVPFAIMMY